jgi:prevent-host-death family protein
VSEGEPRARVGVRELRQNLSVYLRRVEQGEALDVTDRGRLVARLQPAPVPESSALDRLIAERRAIPASRPVASLPDPIQPASRAPSLSDALRDMRDEERR